MKEFEHFKDEELILSIREGNLEAEETLILRYAPFVRSFTRPYFLAGGDSEDLIQEGMIGVVKAITEFNSSRDASFSTFVSFCVRNRIYSAIRNSNRGKNSPLNNYVSFGEVAASGSLPDPVDAIINREAYSELMREVSKLLSKFEKSVLELYLEGLSYGEISERLSKTQKSVDNAVQRIRRKVSQLYPATSGKPV